MKVFVTGATGFIGSATVPELLKAGHEVLGLARNDAAARKLEDMGAEVHRGELADIDSLTAGAEMCDGVLHLAFIHDFSQYEASLEADRKAIEAISGVLEGTNKPFVVTSGTMMIQKGRTGTEEDTAGPDAQGRAVAEGMALAAAKRGVRAIVMRLPPSVHGAGDHGFVPVLIDIARRKGFSAYVGDGANRWPSVHRLDAARLYRLGLEKAAPGTHLHAVAEEGIAMRMIAETIGEGLGLPVRSISKDEAAAHFDWMASFVAADNPTSSAITRKTMEWQPKEMDLLTDIRESGYFSS